MGFPGRSGVCEQPHYVLNPTPVGYFAGLYDCNAWKLHVGREHSPLVAFHYEPEADRRLSLGDLHRENDSGWFVTPGSGSGTEEKK